MWDHFGCQVLKTRTVWHCTRPHTLRKEGDAWTGATGCRMFALYEPSSTNRVRRYLSVDLGKGGDYRASGSPLPFEVPDADHAKRVQDRLTEEMVLQYL